MSDTMAYVAQCRVCNGKIWMSMDGPRDYDANAEEMPGLIKSGFMINRVTVEEANDAEWCKRDSKCKKEIG